MCLQVIPLRYRKICVMNGTKYLLDTNYILGLLKRYPVVISELSKLNVATAECSYSAITRMELLGYQGIFDKEESIIREKLDYLTYLQINREVEDITINIRRGRKLKLPDAIIAATAVCFDLQLLTLDQHLSAVLFALRQDDG